MENGNTPAFVENNTTERNGHMTKGLTKREYFAGLAMQGMIANAPNGHLSNCKEGVPLAVQWADELLKQLSNPHK